jgi:plasmid stabilization system protein ParE
MSARSVATTLHQFSARALPPTGGNLRAHRHGSLSIRLAVPVLVRVPRLDVRRSAVRVLRVIRRSCDATAHVLSALAAQARPPGAPVTLSQSVRAGMCQVRFKVRAVLVYPVCVAACFLHM